MYVFIYVGVCKRCRYVCKHNKNKQLQLQRLAEAQHCETGRLKTSAKTTTIIIKIKNNTKSSWQRQIASTSQPTNQPTNRRRPAS